jgi:predicted nucleic acid-binding protein
MNENIEFIAIVKEVKAKALVSLDKSARIILETEDLSVMDLGKWPADETVSVAIFRNQKYTNHPVDEPNG